MATDEILEVHYLGKEGGEYIAKCPHCGRILSLEGDDLSEMRNEIYMDPICGCLLMVSGTAKFDRKFADQRG